MHKWKYYMGRCHPDHAYFFWSCSHSEIDSFRWLIRTIKGICSMLILRNAAWLQSLTHDSGCCSAHVPPAIDCEDEVYDMRAKSAKDMSQKRFEFHIFVSSVPKGQQ